MIEQATVDAYGDSEQITGWFTMIEENLAVPFETKVLGVPVTVERVDLDRERADRRDLPARACAAVAPNHRSAIADAAAGWRGMDRSISPLACRKPSFQGMS